MTIDITGRTHLIAHIGFPTESFKAPMIYNPWFEHAGIDAVVVPLGVPAGGLDALVASMRSWTNLIGALVTMPHKVAALALADDATPTARVAGAANALRFDAGRITADQFDGAGFVRGARRNGAVVRGARALVVGNGGVGRAIAASLAAEGPAELGLFDADPRASDELAARLRLHHPDVRVRTGITDPAGWDIVVNATPLGMKPDDPLPMDATRIDPHAFVGEVVMKDEMTPFLRAAAARGCRHQVGTDMLFEMVPAYLEFFGLASTTPQRLRELARLRY